MARREQGWNRAGLLGLARARGSAAVLANAQAALSTPTPGRDERGASERSAPSDACVEAASSTAEARAAPQPAKEA